MRNRISHIIKPLVAGLLFSTIALFAHGQIVTTNNAPHNNANYLINTTLMGQGGMVGYNVNAYGASIQYGYFHSGMGAINMDTGIIMSTGNISGAMGTSFNFASTNIPAGGNQGGGDNDLLTTAQSVPPLINQNFSISSAQDAVIIDFDFVPKGDTVTFEYVFASEEYTGWINTGYNDVFGFYLSGPGINGTYSNNAINVATIPNTNPALPITISTIHPSLNGSYYNSSANLMSYNGYTDVMTAILPVQACDTFHIKLGLADCGDGGYDSGVFIKGGSFESSGLIVEPTPSYNPYGNDTAFYEGCGDVTVYFTRSDSVLAQDTLTYEVWGAADMRPYNGTGGDYSHLVNSLGDPCQFNTSTGHWECDMIFLAGEETDSITFDVFMDNINEGIENMVIAISDSEQLYCQAGDTIEYNILDQPELLINAYGDITLDCNDDSAQIGVSVSQGLPPYSFAWDNGSLDSSQYVMPTTTTAYVVTVQDACGAQSETDFVNVSVFNVPWSTVKIGNNQTIRCIDPPVDIGVGVQFNDNIWHGDISYLWSTGETDSIITVTTTVDTSFQVTITRNCTGEEVVHNLNLYAYNDPVVTSTKDIPDTYFDCPGDTAIIKVSTAGGYVPYSFQWSNGATDSTTLVNPMTTTTYTVTVMDVCELVEYVDSVVVNVPVPEPLEIHNIKNDTVPCTNIKVNFGPAYPVGGFNWGYTFSWDNFETISDSYSQILFETDSFEIWLTDGCRTDTVSKIVYGVVSDKSNLKLTMPEDTLICFGDELVLSSDVEFGAETYVYEWSNGSKAANTRVSPKTSTTYNLRVTDFCDTVRNGSVHVDVSRVKADFDWEYLNDYELQLTNKSTANNDLKGYIWDIEQAGIESFEESPIIPLPNGSPYLVKLTSIDEYGCEDIDTITVSPTHRLYIPTGFTPNSDNINDVWSIRSLGIREMRLEIYDRWGETLFSTSDKDFEWDGKVQGKRVPMGSYAYRLVFFTDQGEYVEKRGVVNVLNDFQKRNE